MPCAAIAPSLLHLGPQLCIVPYPATTSAPVGAAGSIGTYNAVQSLQSHGPSTKNRISNALFLPLAGIEAAVQAVKCVETLTVMGKLLYNCAVSPKEEKFRRIKLTNKKIAETIGATAGAIDALLALGWEYEEQDAQELVIRQGTYFTMKEVGKQLLLLVNLRSIAR